MNTNVNTALLSHKICHLRPKKKQPKIKKGTQKTQLVAASLLSAAQDPGQQSTVRFRL